MSHPCCCHRCHPCPPPADFPASLRWDFTTVPPTATLTFLPGVEPWFRRVEDGVLLVGARKPTEEKLC